MVFGWTLFLIALTWVCLLAHTFSNYWCLAYYYCQSIWTFSSSWSPCFSFPVFFFFMWCFYSIKLHIPEWAGSSSDLLDHRSRYDQWLLCKQHHNSKSSLIRLEEALHCQGEEENTKWLSTNSENLYESWVVYSLQLQVEMKPSVVSPGAKWPGLYTQPCVQNRHISTNIWWRI